MKRSDQCPDCGHSDLFHADLNGQPRPCDAETVTPYGLGEMPSLCRCRAAIRAQELAEAK